MHIENKELQDMMARAAASPEAMAMVAAIGSTHSGHEMLSHEGCTICTFQDGVDHDWSYVVCRGPAKEEKDMHGRVVFLGTSCSSRAAAVAQAKADIAGGR